MITLLNGCFCFDYFTLTRRFESNSTIFYFHQKSKKVAQMTLETK